MTSLCQQKINFKFNQILFIYGQQFSYFRATGRQDGKTEAKGFLIRLTSRPFLSGQLPKGEKNHPKQGVRKTYERKVCCLRPCRRVPKNTPANQFNRPDEKAKEDKKTSRNVCTKQTAENVCEPCRFVVRAAVSSQKRPKAFGDGLPKMLNWSCYRGKGGCFSGSQFHPWLWLFFRPTSASRADRWDADNFPVRAFSLECLCK